MNRQQTPVVLVFAGSDPTGGAGIQADIQTLTGFGCHPAPVVTAVTAQDTVGIKQFVSVNPDLVIGQARAVLEDMTVTAIKIGMLGTTENLTAIAGIKEDYPEIPVILDPVQLSGAGQLLMDEPLDDALRALLIPQTFLLTPNSMEARQLAAEADTLDACAQELMSLGCRYVLLTGTHENTPEIINRLYGNMRLLDTFVSERLPDQFHGSGCTLASACAAGIAHGLDPVNAAATALAYTWKTLKYAQRLGMGQLLPNRQYASHEPIPADTSSDESTPDK